MVLYLVQHGEAIREADDPARPLSAKGRDDVARVARFLHQQGVCVDAVRHSGKLRAEQTAAILAAALAVGVPTAAMTGLAPNDPVEPIAAGLEAERGALMLVGHQPFMGRLAGLLLVGSPDRAVALFQMGGVVCLTKSATDANAPWAVAWAVSPQLLR
jgi:phosphohistidine phosphatase